MLSFIPRHELLLISRVLMSILFFVMGWTKLMGFNAAVAYMQQTGAPVPEASAILAIIVELGSAIAIVLGVFLEPIAILLGIYTIITGIIGHHFWTMDGMMRYDMMIHFYKNISITGGLLALAVAGPGKYAVQSRQ
ncbi:DoxX family protein [Swingsia samuiensis]|uniref:DoxX family protein n=1 Tax=Swingsia samuiensis TaxID=1293412 RepID=A0A4Y6UHH0_9PROT|nr:DoxX family protein [Swingsia samuiensis]QDH17039.1 DoxX family protein [Swingsia samuiensis]